MNEDVVTLGVLIAFDDLLVGNLGEGLTVTHAFDVADGLPDGAWIMRKATCPRSWPHAA